MLYIKRIIILLFMFMLMLAPAAYCIYLPYTYNEGEKILPCYVYDEMSELTEQGILWIKIFGIIYILIITIMLFLTVLSIRYKKLESTVKITNIVLIVETVIQYMYMLSKRQTHYGELTIPGTTDWMYIDKIYFLEMVLAVIIFVSISADLNYICDRGKKFIIFLYGVYILLIYYSRYFIYGVSVVDRGGMEEGGDSFIMYNIFGDFFPVQKNIFFEYMDIIVPIVVVIIIKICFKWEKTGMRIQKVLHKGLDVITTVIYGYTMYNCIFSENMGLFYPDNSVVACMVSGALILLIPCKYIMET